MQRINQTIATNFKIIREKRKLSLDAAAKLTGVSKSMLAQIERGDVSPTVVTLWKLANGLKVPFTEFLQEQRAEVGIVSGIDPLLEDGGRYRNYPLFTFDEQRRFEICTIELDPGCVMSAEAHPPSTEEFITVFKGSLQLELKGETWDIAAGSAARFKADIPHTYRNRNKNLCRLSMVLYYPPPV